MTKIKLGAAAIAAALTTGLAGGAALAEDAAAQSRFAGTQGQTAGTVQQVPEPRYRIELVSFRADDESGWDGSWAAPVSDEPYFVISSVTTAGTAATKKTKTFGDVDTGESRTVTPSQGGCVFPTNCGSRAAGAGIGVSVQLIEEDGGDAAKIVSESAKYFRYAGTISSYTPAPSWVSKAFGYMGDAADYIGTALKDDPIGTQTFAFSRADLEFALPKAGDSFNTTKYFGGLDTSGGADYHAKFKVTRVS